jgi:hypothetical protein
MEINWKLLLDALTIFGGALAWGYQWWNARFRSQLKGDFEILKSLEPLGQDEDNYRIVKAHIDATIAKAYACGRVRESNQVIRGEPSHINRIDLILSIIFLLGSALWTRELIEVGINWWRILIALGFASSGLGALFNVIHKNRVSKNVEATYTKEARLEQTDKENRSASGASA